jgi:predicted short-subunit dehydrogenase-like oxidoreductase (DUF2520 family)
VGLGRLGQALAIALQSSQYRIQTLVARRATQARKAVALLTESAGRVDGVLSILQLGLRDLSKLLPSDIILITTPDDAIEETARLLAINGKESGRDRVVFHTSGALSSEVLAPLAKAGFHTGSLHPLVSVSEPRAGAETLRGAFYCLEGDKTALRIARLMVEDLGGKSFSIQPERKALYHAAAVMASPHLVALFDLATEMLACSGVTKKSAREILLPLVESTVNNLKAMNSERALTGTFARGDVATVRRHLNALSGKRLAEALAVYELLGRRSVQLAKKNKVDPRRLAEIRKLLDSTSLPQGKHRRK